MTKLRKIVVQLFRLALVLTVALSQYSLLAKQSSTSLYGLIVCDTLSQDIKEVTASDKKKIAAILSMISEITGGKETTTILDGKEMSYSRLSRWILSTHPSENDIVFCYFGCHGFRDPRQQTPWPKLLFPFDNMSLDGNDFLNIVTNMKPRLTIIIFECCNKFAAYKAKGLGCTVHLSLQRTGIRTLFTEHRGIAVVCSASAGEAAYGIPDTKDWSMGGIFTSSFLSALAQESHLTYPSWTSIFKKASDECHSTTYQLTNSSQTPYFQVNISSIEKG
jgi:hypothetical protein